MRFSHTRKVGTTGRHRARVGLKLRKALVKIEEEAKRNRCPNCGKRVKRISYGIWLCEGCDLKFAGEAYLVR